MLPSERLLCEGHPPSAIAVIGESGSGKSSLINAICGRYIAEVGVVETTSEPQEFTIDGTNVIYVDLPGAGTAKWPTKTYVSDLKLLTDYDAFIFVNRGRISETDIAIYGALRRANRHVFIARSNFDRTVRGESRRPGHLRCSNDELRDKIVADVRKQFQDPNVKVFVTAALAGRDTFELPKLIIAIENALSSISNAKGIRFVAGAKAYTREMLQRKEEAARVHVHTYAVVAAASDTAIPIPGVGIAADMATVIVMNETIARTFNIDVHGEDRGIVAAIGPMLTTVNRFVTREGVTALLRQFAGAFIIKESVKFNPVLGSIDATATAAAMIELVGHQAIREFRDSAERILDAGV